MPFETGKNIIMTWSEDRRLIEAVAQGDGKAWTAFVDRTAGWVHAAARTVFAETQADEEALRLFQKLRDNHFAALRDYNGRSTLETFLSLRLADLLVERILALLIEDASRMAGYDDTVDAWESIHETLGPKWNGRVIPITYVNSSAAIKAFVGEHGGACCTSSNAHRIFQWALEGGTQPVAPGEEIKLLFLPDQHLGIFLVPYHLPYTIETEIAWPEAVANMF